ncbi:MAG: hypothetical protein ACLP9L_28280 [Thermoguttaceae bacterium]|jgi:hypothetical protein
MDNNRTAASPKLQRRVGPGNPTAIKGAAARRTAARKAYRAKIEALLGESRDEKLAGVWQRVCPFRIDPVCELPDRRGIIEDLADFAEVLRPRLDGMKAHRLCRLVEKYAAYESRQSGSKAAKTLC